MQTLRLLTIIWLLQALRLGFRMGCVAAGPLISVAIGEYSVSDSKRGKRNFNAGDQAQ